MPLSPSPFRIQRFLAGLRYPATKGEAVHWARMKGADESIVRALCALPERPFESPVALSCAVATSR